MKSDSVLEPVREVWEWRKLLQKNLEKLSSEEQVREINQIAKEVCRRYNLRVRSAADKAQRG
jgi:hypothetical protein